MDGALRCLKTYQMFSFFSSSEEESQIVFSPGNFLSDKH